MHEGLRNYICEKCHKSFSTPRNLKVHVDTVHEGLKQHKCALCEKAYGQSGDLKRHIKRFHFQQV